MHEFQTEEGPITRAELDRAYIEIERLRDPFAYEYRVTWQHPRHPDWRAGDSNVFRSDDEMWQNWVPDAESVKYDPGIADLRGVEGIVEATRREAVAAGYKNIRVERRRVGPWEIQDGLSKG